VSEASPNGAAPASVAAKPGRHREATLYRPLAGAGAGGQGLGLAELRERALATYEASPLPTWRRSGFWSTSFEDLHLEELQVRHHPAHATELPEVVARTVPERGARGSHPAGRLVQLDGSVIEIELNPALAERGVILCSLEEAAREHRELFERWYSLRLPYDRNKLEAANAAFWTGGAFLHVPKGLVVEEPFEIVYAIERPGAVQYARTLIVGEEQSEFAVHEYKLGEDPAAAAERDPGANEESGTPEDATEGRSARQGLHAGAFEMYLRDGARCRLAHVQDWGPGEIFDLTTRFVGVGRDAYCHWLPALLGGHLTSQHLELAVSEPGGDMAFRGIFFAERTEHLDLFAVDLHETGPSDGDVHWRGAASGQSRASFEGLIKINPGAQQTHTYLQIHTMMLSPRARLDAIPSVLVSADDVSASHGGTVGELDENAIFYMQSRGLDRPAAVRVIVEGFFEPLIAELKDAPLEELVRGKIAAKLSAAREDIETYATSR
jgi:Fe-S cluster assembly scaffold protein SufB